MTTDRTLAVLAFLASLVALFYTYVVLPSHDALAKTAHRSYVYKHTPQGDLSLIMDTGPGWRPSDKRAAIIFFFPGAWRYGNPSIFAVQSTYLASLGMVAIRADYRIKTRFGDHVTPWDGTQDGRSALRWVRAHAGELGIDPNKIVASGGSAGGQLSLCALMCDSANDRADDLSISPAPNALILLSAVTHITYQSWINAFNGQKDRVSAVDPFIQLPFYLGQHHMPPTLFLFGENDPLAKQGHEFMGHIIKQQPQAQVELIAFAKQPHSFYRQNPFNESSLMAMTHFLASLGYLSPHNNMLYAPTLSWMEFKPHKHS